MAFTPTNQLTPDPHIWLRNQQHASRMFTDDQFRLAPKAKFSFHVSFGINPNALQDVQLIQRHTNEINMLVKSVQLPTFTMTNETMNQYNRKKVIQIQHKIDNINIIFHDDNMGIINALWRNYYTYYYADSASAASGNAYARNATKFSTYINGNYGLDNGSTDPFFTYIKVYQMGRHEYISYQLVNPVIATWVPSALSYASSSGGDFAEYTMGISCEAVSYANGQVTPETVEGFGVEHYDTTPSPLGVSATASINAGSLSPSLVSSVRSPGNETTVTSLVQNASVSSGTSGILGNIMASSVQGVSGLQGVTFPLVSGSATTQATPVTLGN